MSWREAFHVIDDYLNGHRVDEIQLRIAVGVMRDQFVKLIVAARNAAKQLR